MSPELPVIRRWRLAPAGHSRGEISKLQDLLDILHRNGATLCGPVPWGTPLPDRTPGVYVITAAGQDVVYIGRAGSSLQKRLGQFYRHVYGRRSPHRGGQDILLLTGPLEVYWATTRDYVAIEHGLIEAFHKRWGRKPIGNKNRGTRLRAELRP
jgi:hypothetical protein